MVIFTLITGLAECYCQVFVTLLVARSDLVYDPFMSLLDSPVVLPCIVSLHDSTTIAYNVDVQLPSCPVMFCYINLLMRTPRCR